MLLAGCQRSLGARKRGGMRACACILAPTRLRTAETTDRPRTATMNMGAPRALATLRGLHALHAPPLSSSCFWGAARFRPPCFTGRRQTQKSNAAGTRICAEKFRVALPEPPHPMRADLRTTSHAWCCASASDTRGRRPPPSACMRPQLPVALPCRALGGGLSWFDWRTAGPWRQGAGFWGQPNPGARRERRHHWALACAMRCSLLRCLRAARSLRRPHSIQLAASHTGACIWRTPSCDVAGTLAWPSALTPHCCHRTERRQASATLPLEAPALADARTLLSSARSRARCMDESHVPSFLVWRAHAPVRPHVSPSVALCVGLRR